MTPDTLLQSAGRYSYGKSTTDRITDYQRITSTKVGKKVHLCIGN